MKVEATFHFVSGESRSRIIDWDNRNQVSSFTKTSSECLREGGRVETKGLTPEVTPRFAPGSRVRRDG